MRSIFIIFAILLLIAFGLGAVRDAGSLSVNFVGYQIDTTATMAFLIIGVLALIAVFFWQTVIWMARAPQRAARKAQDVRRRQGEEVITRGFLAVANGDASEAKRLSVKALDFSDNIALVRILGAMAAEISEDQTAAKSAYTAMLSVPELKMAGLRGLLGLASGSGQPDEMVRLATEAFMQPKSNLWAFKALFEARLSAREWDEALSLIDTALSRKLISPIYADRARAGVMVAKSSQITASPNSSPQDQETALELSLKAAKSQPSFSPASLIAAKLYKEAGKIGRAEDVLESAYQAAPHPALWLSYRDLINDETPRQRATRLSNLEDRQPDHPESRILTLERALIANDVRLIDQAVERLKPVLDDAQLTRRVCGVMARVSLARGKTDEARSWVAKAGLVRSDLAWSDIDETGQAFRFSHSDWINIITHYAQTGQMLHPRGERGERTLPELPDLPSRYLPSMPFIRAAQNPDFRMPLPDDPGASPEMGGDSADTEVQTGQKPKTTRQRPVKTPKT